MAEYSIVETALAELLKEATGLVRDVRKVLAEFVKKSAASGRAH